MLMKALSLVLCLAAGAVPPTLSKSESRPITAAVPEDPALQAVIGPRAKEIQDTFGLVLCEAPKGLFRGRRGEENLLGYWVADLMRERATAQLGRPVKVAITNQGGLRSNLRPGTLKVSDVYEVLPFENELVVVEFTGAQVIQMVKEGILRRSGEPISGVKAVVEGTPEAARLVVTWEDGSAIDPTEVVRVATSDYLAASGDSMATIKQGRNLATTGLVLRQILLDACEQAGKAKRQVLPPAPGRYRIAPEMLQALSEKKVRFQES